MIETPSRIWRRIEAIEDRDMPSLPSLPPFEDSGHLSGEDPEQDESDDDLHHNGSPIHSTPAAASAHHTAASTIRPSSTLSAARFASSIASRSTKSSLGLSSSRGMSTRKVQVDSFDISMIPSLPDIHAEPGTDHFSYDDEDLDLEESKESVPDVYLPPQGDYDDGSDLSLSDALQSVSRSGSPPHSNEPYENGPTPKKYDFSVSLRSEPKVGYNITPLCLSLANYCKPSPFDKFRNVAVRKTLPRARTPSLSRTTSSRASSPANSTPQSTRSFALPRSSAGSPVPGISVPLPRSATASPAVAVHQQEEEATSEDERHSSAHETDIRSMDITDLHISPPGMNHQPQSEDEKQQSGQQELLTEDETGSPDERDPTFSSDGDPSPYTQPNHNNSSHNSSVPISTAFSSPAPSMTFTPTPVFPRPRARFNLPSPPNGLVATPAQSQPQEEGEDGGIQEEEPLTPHTRRRSFLLSVINSTARPRLKFPTPHPRNFVSATPSIAESTPEPGVDPGSVTGMNLQMAFAGITPRPRARNSGRPSHPLAQTVIPSPATSDSESAPATESIARAPAPKPTVGWATPAAQAQASPYDGASFISTASSHDLTTHQRANTSFDPAMGFGTGAQGHGVGRFNAGKLNSYLHGLNRRLQEENEVLVERLRKVEGERKAAGGDAPVPIGSVTSGVGGSGRRVSGGGRRVSTGGTLGNVEENVGAESWVEEKAELEEMIDALKDEVAGRAGEKEEAEKALAEERAERVRDKERWKDRMGEVERGVEEIVKELEKKLQSAEERAKEVEEQGSEQIRDMEKKVLEVEGERDVAMERAGKAEKVLESGKELGGELREANERVGKVLADLRNANAQIKELEDEILRADSRIEELERDLKEDREIISALEEKLTAEQDEVAAEKDRFQQMEEAAHQIDNELRTTKAYVAELEEDAGAAVERIETLEEEMNLAHEKLQSMGNAEEESHERIEKLEAEAQNTQEWVRQMEEALEAAEKKMVADEEELADYQAKVASLEREKQRVMVNVAQDESREVPPAGPTEAELEALEDELDNANKEIARLTTMLNQSPARKALEKAKETRIELLEREKEELLERNKALRMTFNEVSTPGKLMLASGISPIHRQVLSMSVRAPRTPGGPLRDVSAPFFFYHGETYLTPSRCHG